LDLYTTLDLSFSAYHSHDAFSGIRGSPGDKAHGAPKPGTIGFTKSLASEVAKTGITAGVVVQGLLKTDMTAPLFNTENRLKSYL